MTWDRVYRLVKQIPRGHLTTYGDLAKALREPGGARVVGYAMAATPSGRGIPWHRVVSAGGKIKMPEPHASKQRRLLETEGVDLSRASIDMDRYGWIPRRPKARKKPRKKAVKRRSSK